MMMKREPFAEGEVTDELLMCDALTKYSGMPTSQGQVNHCNLYLRKLHSDR